MKKFIVKLLIFSIFCLTPLYSQHQIKSYVFGNGGAAISNTDYNISSTIGQTFTGMASNTDFTHYSGYWRSVALLTNLLDEELIPIKFELLQNYPNPFNPNTNIKYSIAKQTRVRIEVYNILGQRVAVLVNENKSPGNYTINFDGRNMASGFYIYRMQSKEYNSVKKMILTK
jgi:type IX secretion system substrate protein